MPRCWTPHDDAELRRLYATAMTVREIAAVLGRTLSSVENRRTKIGLKKPPGAPNRGRFQPDSVPWNAGLHWVAGGRSVETRFRPGHRPHTWQPIGHERLSKEGILQRKMTDTGVSRRDYVPVHVLVWRGHHGPVPAGCIVIFRNGNRRDFRIENLECISRAENMRRNSLHAKFPPKVTRLIQLRGALTRQINKREKRS